MPIEVGIWKLGATLQPIGYSRMESEQRLESVLTDNIEVIDDDLMLVGRQVPTAYGKFIDLLALDSEGRVVVIELKRDRTPREVVAQLLDYGSWVRDLDDDEIGTIYEKFVEKHLPAQRGQSLDDAYRERFGDGLPEGPNETHKLVLVASELDDSSERIITYLADEYGVAINAVFFRVFRDGDTEYLSRAWLSDPDRVEEKVEQRRERKPWNGEFYATFGDGLGRSWEDARKYGFICAGGGRWYSQTLNLLEPGGRVWVNTSGGRGYVGVGIVESEALPIEKFTVGDGSGKQVPITGLPLNGSYHQEEGKADPDKAEYFVRVRWIKALPLDQAIKEKGLFGIQHSAARPRAKKWEHTVERLKQRFGITEDPV